MVIEPQYDFAESFSEGLAAVRDEELIGYIDPAGEMIIPTRFDDAGPFRDGLARVERAHQWGYIKPNGTPAFLLPVSVAAPTSTLIIPFLPGVPAETRDGLCVAPSLTVPGPSAWQCIVESDDPDEISIIDPCLVAGDGQTVVCSIDPLVGGTGFQVNLIDPLPAAEEASAEEADTNNKAWLIQLADGAVCRFTPGIASTIDGERANYACSDSSILLGDLQPGAVWQANQVALGDIVRTDDGYTANRINPIEVAVIWQPADPAATLAEIGLSPDQVSLDTTNVAETIEAQIRPAVPYDPELATSLDGEPAHLRFAFENEDLSELGGVSPHQAQLLIYPVEAYLELGEAAGVEDVAQRIEALERIIAGSTGKR